MQIAKTPEQVGCTLKDLRGSKTMTEVSNSLGISCSALGMYETGKRIPRDEIKLKIANYYGRPLESIFYAEKLPEPTKPKIIFDPLSATARRP